jgi:hypothetical protein
MRLGKPRDRVKITAFAEKRKLVLRRVKLFGECRKSKTAWWDSNSRATF